MMLGTPSVEAIRAAEAPAGPEPMISRSVSTSTDSVLSGGSGPSSGNGGTISLSAPTGHRRSWATSFGDGACARLADGLVASESGTVGRIGAVIGGRRAQRRGFDACPEGVSTNVGGALAELLGERPRKVRYGGESAPSGDFADAHR